MRARKQMNYNKLVFHESAWPGSPGRTVMIDFDLNEIIVDSMAEGVKWGHIGPRERSTIEAKLNTGRPDEWGARYIGPAMDGSCWNLRLLMGSAIVKESSGSSGYPPQDQWRAFRSLVAFCFAVTRRYGEYRPPKAV